MIPTREADRIAEIRRRLLDFFDREKRDLPWRADRDPYRVWVSEVMLQQTRVETVVPYYERWLERFPDVVALASAGREDVLESWAGLGYYARARNLHDAARVVRERFGGEVPDTAAELRELPGVGEYIAGAVASIAFGRPEPAVDGNARRVLSRLFDLEAPTPARLRKLAARLVPVDRPGEFNQALMELGATVCLPKSPECAACPVEELCRAREKGTVAERPGTRPGRRVPTFAVGTAVVVSARGHALLARRSEAGLLGGMWEFPGAVAAEVEPPAAAASRAAGTLVGTAFLAAGPDGSTDAVALPDRRLDRVEHLFSHRRHVYHAYLFDAAVEADPSPGGEWTAAEWVPVAGIRSRALPAAQRKIAGTVAAIVRGGSPC